MSNERDDQVQPENATDEITTSDATDSEVVQVDTDQTPDLPATVEAKALTPSNGYGLLLQQVPADVLPASECLADVVARMLPYWFDVIVGDLAGDRTVLVAAHGNSLRALVKHLDQIPDDEIAGLDIPTGVPLVYELDGDGRPTEAKPALARALGDPEAVAAAAAAVANQATAGA